MSLGARGPDASSDVETSTRFGAQIANRPGRRVRAGALVYSRGEGARSVYILRSGLVKTALLAPTGESVTVRVHRPGEIFGELCLCADERTDRATALEASEVVELPLPIFLAQLQRDPKAALEFATSVCERLAESYEQLLSTSVDTVLGRLGRTLLALAHAGATAGQDDGAIPRAITQDELAHMIGARREVVSSLLNRLRDAQVIRYDRRLPMHVDRDALERFLRSAERE